MKSTAIFDRSEQERIQERLDKLRAIAGAKSMKQPFFKQSDVKYRCTCCTPSRKQIITLDPLGREQYTCPNSRITMRHAPCKPLPYTSKSGKTKYRSGETYMAGHLILPG